MFKRNIFVNLPVKDLKKSIAFYGALGFSFNPQFTDDNAACIVISEEIYVMLLTEPFFSTFTSKTLTKSEKEVEVINALSASSREEVDELANKAEAAGAYAYNPPQDHGFMYTRSFQDPDHHLWEVFYMDPNYIKE